MKKMLCSGLAAAVFALGSPAQDWKSAIEKLPSYDFGQSRVFLVPLDEAVRAAGTNNEGKALEKALAQVLAGNATIEARRYTLRAIAPIATAESVPVIAKLATDPHVGDIALWALERVTDPAAANALIDALAAAPPEHQVPFILSLGWRREVAAVAPLAALLTGTNEAIGVAAANALARIASTDACDKIREAHKAAPGSLRAALSLAALNCAEQFAADDKTKAQAVEIYTDLSAADESYNVRAAALNGLVKAEPENALKRVIAAYTGEDADLALVANGFVRTLPGKEATEAFAALVGEVTPEHKAALIDALADRGDAGAHDAVAAAATSPDDTVKLAAIKALGRLGNASDVALLNELNANASADLKRAAQTSLNTLPGDDVNKALFALAAEGDVKLRSAAITALTERRAKDVRADVTKLLDDADATIRSDAAAALEVLAEPSDLPALLARLAKGGDEAAVASLERVIAAVSNRIPDEGKRAAQAASAQGKASTPAQRVSLVRVLAAVHTKDSLTALQAQVQGDDDAARLAAVTALAAWPTMDAGEVLLKVGEAPRSEEEGSLALGGYVRLVREAEMPCGSCRVDAYEKALGLAKTNGTKKQIIAGLGTSPTLRALELLESLKAEPELATDASSGIISVARMISGAHPALAKEKLIPFTKADTPDALKKPADMAIAHLNLFEDYITAWEVSGPYFESGVSGLALFDKAFAPENAPDEAKWNIAPLAFNSGEFKPFTVDLGAVIGGQERLAYLRTKIKAAKAQEAVLELGTNDGCKVWLDGTLIHSFKEGRPLVVGEDKINLSLTEGDHTLMIAVYQQGWHWGACARLATPTGAPAEGLSTSVE